MTDTASTETSVPEAAIEAAELIAVIDADRRAGRSLCPDNDLRLAATIARYCLAESTITLSATDALALCRATAERDIAAAAPQNEALAPSDAERERVIEGLKTLVFDLGRWDRMQLGGDAAHRAGASEAKLAVQERLAPLVDAAIALLHTPSPLPHVSAEAFDELEAALTNPAQPTQSIRDGANLIHQIYGKPSPLPHVETGGEGPQNEALARIHKRRADELSDRSFKRGQALWMILSVATGLVSENPLERIAKLARDAVAGDDEVEQRAPVETAPAGVRVKKLEWNPYRSEVSIGKYRVSDFPLTTGLFGAWFGPSVIGYFRSVTEAKAAAQADFERRILSAIERPQP